MRSRGVFQCLIFKLNSQKLFCYLPHNITAPGGLREEEEEKEEEQEEEEEEEEKKKEDHLWYNTRETLTNSRPLLHSSH
ncbi:hypothetical protein E2C01_021858 [Portunus trituberculatus]|uniref:Uncharacterized protein n=1 Tax=Portunus trituberculatus TaxID=210409 RepID=A0A5B7E4I8_PORTR|nr:hypothetical protein [Portunus trituberculatus]